MISWRMTCVGLSKNQSSSISVRGHECNVYSSYPNNNLCTLEEFRSISLCNLVYKIVSKIIASILKKAMSQAFFRAT